MWHLRVGNSKVVGPMLRMEVRADGSLEKGSLVLFQAIFFPSFRGKKNSSYVGIQLSNWMRQLMQPEAVIHSSILNAAEKQKHLVKG